MSPHVSSSSTSSSNDGSAYPWILEHLLAYPGTYEIPLRTMYTLNSTTSIQQYPRQSIRPDTPSLSSTASSPDDSPQSPQFPPEQQVQLAAQNAAAHFKSCLMTHISQLPTQPFSLPPAFITSFVRRCFTEDLCLVDFTQALTAMDYLKDLENRRKRELTLALQRFGLDQAVVEPNSGEVCTDPLIAEWVKSMQEKERKVEALYAHCYVGLRRWTLINEMRLEPFNKANCIAMLNTLYPPSPAKSPTRQLSITILSSQRGAFFRYITGVEKNGKDILKNLEDQGKNPGDANGWAVVRDLVDKYLRTANGVIDECMDVNGPAYFGNDHDSFQRNERRADSGVSFATGDRPSTSSSTGSKPNLVSVNKPLPVSPPHAHQPPSTPKKRGTTLERIAREIRNLRNRKDVTELSHQTKTTQPEPTPKEQPRSRSLRKMKSTSSIGGARFTHSRSGSDEPMPTFDLDARRRQLILEAQREKESQSPSEVGNRNAPVASTTTHSGFPSRITKPSGRSTET